MNFHDLAGKLGDLARNDPLSALAVGARAGRAGDHAAGLRRAGPDEMVQGPARAGLAAPRRSRRSSVAMMLVMGIPAIFAALVVKSQDFDKDRYEFDPNKTWSVLEQGRQLQERSTRPTRRSRRRWRAWPRSGRTWSTTSRSSTRRCSRSGPSRGPRPPWRRRCRTCCSGWPECAGASAVDGPQQLMDFTAPPVDLAALPMTADRRRDDPGAGRAVAPRPRRPPRPATGLTKAEAEAELATVPEPATPLAAMLPLADLPAGWTVGKSGDEAPGDVQRREPVREDRRPGRELHPVRREGDGLRLLPPDRRRSNEVQVYIFELATARSRSGKYGSREARGGQAGRRSGRRGTPRPAARSSTRARTTPRSSRPRTTRSSPTSPWSWPGGSPRRRRRKPGGGGRRRAASREAASTPEALFALLPGARASRAPKFVAAGRLRLQLPLRRLHGRLRGRRRDLAGLPPPLPPTPRPQASL